MALAGLLFASREQAACAIAVSESFVLYWVQSPEAFGARILSIAERLSGLLAGQPKTLQRQFRTGLRNRDRIAPTPCKKRSAGGAAKQEERETMSEELENAPRTYSGALLAVIGSGAGGRARRTDLDLHAEQPRGAPGSRAGRREPAECEAGSRSARDQCAV